jgi:hypothetical protein
MTKAEHPPTPWKVIDGSCDDYIVDRHGHPVVCIAELNGCDTVEQTEIAAFIVEAVNNHEALKARVKELEKLLQSLLDMPAACTTIEEATENTKRHRAASIALNRVSND